MTALFATSWNGAPRSSVARRAPRSGCPVTAFQGACIPLGGHTFLRKALLHPARSHHSASLRLASHSKNRMLHPILLPVLGLICFLLIFRRRSVRFRTDLLLVEPDNMGYCVTESLVRGTSSLLDLKEIGCKGIWVPGISPLCWLIEQILAFKVVKICPHPVIFSLRFFKSGRLLANLSKKRKKHYYCGLMCG